MRYPVKIEKIDGEYVAAISHPGGRFQGACVGNTRTEAMAHMTKLIKAMIVSAIRDGDDVPAPACCNRGNASVIVPPMIAAKAAIYMEMRAAGTRKADMVRAMKVGAKQVDRILDPLHRSTLPQLEAAALCLGKHIDLRLT